MLALLHHFFAGVCGQNLAHTWAPGGVPMPCCQRCTGLYAGALLAGALHLWLKPRLTGRFLWVHGLFLLQMVPFGFHWLPQGPMLRTVTVTLFGFGLVSYFWLLLASHGPTGEEPTVDRYFPALAFSVALVLALSVSNSTACAFALTTLAAAGLLILTALVLTNLWLLATSLLKLSRHADVSTPPPQP